VNFYRVNESCYFVDLPGYGYAKVPRAERASWRPLVEGFFDRRRRRIALALLVIDARREVTELDRTMRDWLDVREIPYVVAATKADKLSASAQSLARQALRSVAGRAAACGEPVLVSVRTGLGVAELWRHLDAALERHHDRE
jgi:GTP-binding protein